jgi:homoserine kinase type II
MAHLADHGIPSARPLPNCHGSLLGELNGKPAALVSFLAGRDVKEADAEHCAAVGTMLARIHDAGQSYRNRMDNPRGLAWWREVTPQLLRFLSPAESQLLQDEVAYQSRHRFDGLPRGAIHADLFRDNVLFENLRISGVIDFYFACTDTLLYDVAITVNDWCVLDDGGLDDARTAALLEAYQAERRLAPDEADAWPVMLRAAALRFWVSRLYDYHLPRPGELTHAKDPAHFQRILERHIREEQKLPVCRT